MDPTTYDSSYLKFFYVYYKMEKGRWVIVAVHPEGERRPHPFTPRTIIEAVDELGAFQKVSKWLQKSNAALAEQDVSLYTTDGSTGVTLTGR